MRTPQDLNGYYGLGLAYRKMGRFDKSIEALQSAHSFAPNDLDILKERGVIYFLSGKLDQAMENLEAVRSKPSTGADQNNDLLTLYYLGRAYQEKGELSKALPLFLKVKKRGLYFHRCLLQPRVRLRKNGTKGAIPFLFWEIFQVERGSEKCPPPSQNGYRMAGKGKSREGRGSMGSQRAYAEEVIIHQS